ncbi:putative fructokinase [Medicago truncatula]|uniref:Putative fructokinase n=1 Tax=Medicago truncatula TaxID=3880 RepID=A0A396I712_MEDTR|nr:putative fructokinase [Medicago truncatula]
MLIHLACGLILILMSAPNWLMFHLELMACASARFPVLLVLICFCMSQSLIVNSSSKAKIFHYGSIGLIYEQCKTSFLAALRFAKTCDCILSYDPKLKLALWPSAEAAREGIMSIWNLADAIKISKDEITHLIDAGDPCDDDDVIKKLFHPTLKLLIVTSGSEGCRYYTNDFKGKVRGLNVEPVDTTGAGCNIPFPIIQLIII